MAIKIGKTLEARLQEKNMKHKVAAEMLNMNAKTFSTYVGDVYFPPIDKLADICRLLDIDLNNLLELESNGNIELLISGKEEAKVCSMLRDCDKDEREFLINSIESAYHNIKKHRKKE